MWSDMGGVLPVFPACTSTLLIPCLSGDKLTMDRGKISA